MDEELYERFDPLVSTIANQFHRQFPMIERDEVYQHLWLWFLTKKNKTAEWLALEDQKQADRLFTRSLKNHGLEFCRIEKAKIEGYDPDDEFFYTNGFIKLLLPAVLSDDWKRIQQVLDPSGTKSAKSIASESADWIAYAADIRKAFGKLEERDQNLIYLYYAEEVDAETLREQATPEKSSAKAAQMAANRAVSKMVRLLGGHPHFFEEDFPAQDSPRSEDDGDDL